MNSVGKGTSVPSLNVGASKTVATKHNAKAIGYANHYAPIVANTEIVLNALLAGESLTVRNVFDEWDVLYLSQIVSHLRHCHGIPVKTELVDTVRSDGRTTRYARYFITPEDIAAIKESK